MNRDIYGWYALVGILYWAYNLVIRKLHTKNEPGEGWLLVPFWVFGWPLCLLMLIAATFSDKHKILKNKV